MRDKNDTESVLFLTDGTVSGYFPEFRRTWYIENYDELIRYHSPELTFDTHAITTHEQYEELCQKIEVNKTFLRDLKARISLLRQNKFSAVTFDMVYLPLHYIVRFSPLWFIDVPKIQTITNYGEEIVLANSAYTDLISDTRIWVNEKIINLLETRILMFEGMKEQFERTGEPAHTPPWFSESIAGYWDIAGLPHRVTGTFFSLSTEEQMPAFLTFAKDEPGQDFGWYLTIGESTLDDSAVDEFPGGVNISFSLFLDPRTSAKNIYSRSGKTPEQRTLRLDCTLYANPGITTVLERSIVDQYITPFVRADREGVDVRITFDGNTFEIREHPAAHGNTLIFRGRMMP
jgi:hypothetical protein